MRTKAGFKARREAVGLSQQDIADMLGVRVLSVKRWENPSQPQVPPEDAWDVIERYESLQADAVKAVAGIAGEADAASGATVGSVAITYFRDQAMYDAYGRDEGPYGVANANSRAAAAKLREMGREVTFVYPGAGEVGGRGKVVAIRDGGHVLRFYREEGGLLDGCGWADFDGDRWTGYVDLDRVQFYDLAEAPFPCIVFDSEEDAARHGYFDPGSAAYGHLRDRYLKGKL